MGINKDNNMRLVEFLSSYEGMLSDIEKKALYLKSMSDKAYIEIATLLPEINSNLKKTIKELEDIFRTLKESGLAEADLEMATEIYNDVKSIPGIILEIMTSLQVQDVVRQCIDHIVSAIRITYEFIDGIEDDKIELEKLRIINCLKIMPVLLVAQLENIYGKINGSIRDLKKEFHGIFEILTPTLTVEELIKGKKVENRLETLRKVFLEIFENNADITAAAKERLLNVAGRMESLEKEIPEYTKMLDLSTASTEALEQPLAEILFLNNNLSKTSASAAEILNDFYSGDQSELDCTDKLEMIVALFSTKSEIEIARRVLDGIITIEESGEEGELTLF